jgi:hypothetical protein
MNDYDAVTPDTILRWGNYDYASAAVRWEASEIPTDATVPGTHTLPASLYLAAKPAWFGDAAWPPIGPDVAGYVTPIPAVTCFDTYASAGAFDAVACY